MKKLILLILILSGCATYQPMIDFQSSSASPASYQRDLSECQAYAQQISPAAGTVIGATVGAVLGAAVFAAFGANAGHGAAFGAGVGAVNGAASSGMSQVDVIRRCMQARGYTVLQ